MLDLDNLDPFAGREPRRHGNSQAEAAPEPKSREDRLRDFYARRQPATTAVQKLETRQEDEAEALQLKKRGNDLYEAKDYEGAVEYYTNAIKLAPSAVLYANRAAAYITLGWWDQALRDARAALRKDPENLKALERQGKAHLALDNLDEALKAAAELEGRLPEEQRIGGRRPPEGVRRLQWLGQAARNPSTVEECRAVLAQFGSQVELASPLGVRLRKTFAKALVERSDALDHQRRIRPALPKNRRTEKDVDEIQEITPFAEEALRITSELLQDHPDDADVRYWRGRALVRLGRHADAEVQLHEGLKEEPGHQQIRELAETMNSLEDLKTRGNNFYKEGKLNEAIHLYTMGIEQDSTCMDTRAVATLYYNRSAAYRKRGDFEQALEDANMALVLHPKWCKALYRRGILLLELGRSSESLTELKVVQRADPTFDDELETWLRRAHNWMSKPRGEVNYYQFMRLPMDATKDEIRKQYHRLCLLWHPDKNGGTAEGRQRFEDLQEAYRFLMDDEQRERYDFGIWRDKAVRHHVKVRKKVKDTWDETYDQSADQPVGWGDRHLIEDDKVELITWGERGCPAWLKEKRKEYKRQMYGEDADSS